MKIDELLLTIEEGLQDIQKEIGRQVGQEQIVAGQPLDVRVEKLETAVARLNYTTTTLNINMSTVKMIAKLARDEIKKLTDDVAELRHLTTAASTKTSPETHHATEP